MRYMYKLQLIGHLWENGKWPLIDGPVGRNLTEISMKHGRNITLFEYRTHLEWNHRITPRLSSNHVINVCFNDISSHLLFVAFCRQL